jgi:acetyl-CoA synthetase
VRSQLAQHEYPRQVVFVPELPKTPAGKIHRRKLREQELATADASTVNAAPAAHV